MDSLRFNVCNVAFGVFDEVEQCLIGALRRLGHDVTAERGLLVVNDDVINISVGVMNMPEELLRDIPQLIVYNFEQIGAETSAPIRQSYFRVMRNAFVWDYALDQIDVLRAAGIAHSSYVPYGYAPEVLPAPVEAALVEDIDVMFYGTSSDRRLRVIDSLRAQGLTVAFPSDVIGHERNELVARAKLMLNICTFDSTHTLELVRLAPWFAMGKAVVSELRSDTHWDRSLEGAFYGVPYEGLVDACIELLGNEPARRTLGRRAQQIFLQTSFDQSIAKGIQAYLTAREAAKPSRVASQTVPTPAHLNYSTHDNWHPLAFNVSPDANDDADFTCDLSRELPISETFNLWRFGMFTLAVESFDSIGCARDFATNADIFAMITNCARLLKPGGDLALTLPFSIDSTPKQANPVSPFCVTANEHFFNLWLLRTDVQRAHLNLAQVTHNLAADAYTLHRAGAAELAHVRTQPGAVQSITFRLRKTDKARKS